MSLTFADADIPVTAGRPAEPNPFEDVVRALEPNSGAKVVVLPAGDDPKKSAGKVKRQLSLAGAIAGVSVKSTIETDKRNLRVTFWTVPRIVRKPKA